MMLILPLPVEAVGHNLTEAVMCYLQKDSEGFVLQDCLHGTCADCGWPAASCGRVRQLLAVLWHVPLCCLFWVCKIHFLFLTPFISGGSTLISLGTHNDTPLLVNFPQVWKVVISCYCYMHASWSFFFFFFNSTLTFSGLGGSTRRQEKMPESAFHGLIMWFTTFYFVIYLLIS